MATSHLVSWLDSALDCQIHLDDLQHAWRKIIPLSEFVLLVLKPCVQLDATLCQLRLRSFQLLVRSLIGHSQLEPIFPREVVQIIVGDFLAFFQLRTTGNNLADQRLLQPLISGFLNNAILIIDVLANLRQLHLFDFDRALIFFQPIPGKNLHINHGAFNARRHSQRGVFNIRRFLTKDGAKQLFFRGKLRFTLWCHFAHENVASTNFSPDVHNAGFIELAKRPLTNIRNVCGDFF